MLLNAQVHEFSISRFEILERGFRMSTKNLVLGLIAVFLIVSMSSLSLATPSLGVATNGAYSGSTGQTGLTDYQNYFVDTFLPGADATHGFVIGSSPETLIVWASADYMGVDIWLLTDSAVEAGNSPTINGNELTMIDSAGKNIDGYKPKPYYGINLGTIDSSWYELVGFPGAGQTFYALDVTLAYSGAIAEEHYFFAYADGSKDGILDPTNPADYFSPKTDSATRVPEPGTLALLGMGLFSIGLFGRKKII